MAKEDEKRSRALNEFVAALGMLVRTDEETGEPTDSRDREAKKLADGLLAMTEDKFNELLCFGLLDPEVTAATFSSSVWIQRPASVEAISDKKAVNGKKLVGALQTMQAANSLPIGVTRAHSIVDLLNRLLKTPKGCEVYRSMATVLYEARNEPAAKAALCKSRHA